MTGYAQLCDDELRRVGRVRCIVPGCGRTFKDPDPSAIVMCGKHWRLADRHRRQEIAKLRRLGSRYGWPDRFTILFNRAWHRVADQAIERAMGL